MRRRALLAALCLLLACERAPAPGEGPRRVPAHAYTPAPEARVGEFVTAMKDAVARGDAAGIRRLFDFHALSRRAYAGLPARLLDVGVDREEFVARLASIAANGEQFAHVGTEQHDGSTWQTFRVASGWHESLGVANAPGFDHLSFLLSLNGQGQVRAVDVWVMSVGEAASSAVRRVVMASLSRDELGTLLEGDARLARYSQQLVDITRAVGQQRHADALALLEAAPAELAQQRWVMTMRAGVAARHGTEAYLKAVEALKAAYPQDLVTSYHGAAALLLAGRHDDALAAIAALEQASAPHGYYELSRAYILGRAGRFDEARRAAERARTLEPQLSEVDRLLATLEAMQAAQ